MYENFDTCEKRAIRKTKEKKGVNCTEKSRNRLSVCNLMDRLGRLKLIRQGVVANRQRARPTMTMLQYYYTRLRTIIFI